MTYFNTHNKQLRIHHISLKYVLIKQRGIKKTYLFQIEAKDHFSIFTFTNVMGFEPQTVDGISVSSDEQPTWILEGFVTGDNGTKISKYETKLLCLNCYNIGQSCDVFTKRVHDITAPLNRASVSVFSLMILQTVNNVFEPLRRNIINKIKAIGIVNTLKSKLLDYSTSL